MACNITSTIPLDCLDSAGGLSALYIWSTDGATTAEAKWHIQTGASGVLNQLLTTVTNTELVNQFYELKLIKDTAKRTQTIAVSTANGTAVYTEEVSAVFTKVTSALLEKIKLIIASDNIRVIIRDNLGAFWLLGNERGMVASNLTIESGTALGDANQVTITFQSVERTPALRLNGTDMTAIDAIANSGSATIGGAAYQFTFNKGN